MMKQMLKDPKDLIEMSPDMPGAKEMASAPPWFRDNLLFSYLQGYVFCISVKKLGGQTLLDHAFLKDPPRSSEQILHPEKWHTKRDDPIEIEFPDMSTVLPNYNKIGEGQLGEASILILLRGKITKEPGAEDDPAEKAAAGWGGDKFVLFGRDKDRALMWITDWDTEADAKEFKDALSGVRKDWIVHNPSPKRVYVMSGDLEKINLVPVREKLASAKATPGANKNIDLAALGIKQKAGGGDLTLDGNEDIDSAIDKLMNDPEALNKLLEGAGGELGGMDLGEMMKNPEMQKMVKDMMTQKRPQGKASEDGRTYTNEGSGFSIQAPASAKDWKLDPKPPIPMASVLISSPDGQSQVFIATQAMPMAVSMEMLAPMLEMGPKMAVKNYKKISGKNIKTSGKDGYELQYEGQQAGRNLRFTQRFFVVGNDMVVISAMSGVDTWKDNEKAINETLESFKFLEKSGPDAKDPKDAPKK
jgi:hypothetical protein